MHPNAKTLCSPFFRCFADFLPDWMKRRKSWGRGEISKRQYKFSYTGFAEMLRRVRIDYGFYIFVAALLLIIPIRWIFAALLAALAHELGHYLAVRLLGGGISRGEMTWRGARMEIFPMSPERELICILAGPAASLLVLCLGRIFPRVAICGLIQGCYNLLPIVPLDGGKALHCLLSLLKNRQFWLFSRPGGKIPCKEGKHRVQ